MRGSATTPRCLNGMLCIQTPTIENAWQRLATCPNSGCTWLYMVVLQCATRTSKISRHMSTSFHSVSLYELLLCTKCKDRCLVSSEFLVYSGITCSFSCSSVRTISRAQQDIPLSDSHKIDITSHLAFLVFRQSQFPLSKKAQFHKSHPVLLSLREKQI